MPRPTLAKDKLSISGPMPLMPRQLRTSLPHVVKSQKAIADDYRALASLCLSEFGGLEMRSVNVGQPGHLELSVERPTPTQVIDNSAISSGRCGDSSPLSAVTRREAATGSSRFLSTSSIPTAQLPSTPLDPGPALPCIPHGGFAVDELRVDIGPIYQAYVLATRTLAKQFVKGVPRTSQMFLNAVRNKRADLMALPSEVRSSQVFGQALKDVEIWESLFRSHCSKIHAGIDASELGALFTTAQVLLGHAWGSLGALLNLCESERTQHKATSDTHDPQAPTRTDEEIIQEVHALLQAPCPTKSKSHRSLANNLFARVRRFSGLSKVSKKKEGDATDDDTSSISSFTLVEAISTRRDFESPRYRCTDSDFVRDSLDVSIDPYITELNLSLRASKVIFSAVASHRSRHPNFPKLNGIIRGDKGLVILATVPALVELLTDQFESEDSDHTILIDTFFLFFREFTAPQDLFHALRDRYVEQPPSTLGTTQTADWTRYHIIVKLHVVCMLATWLEQHYVADNDQEILDPISKFLTVVACDRHIPGQAATLLGLRLNRCLAEQNTRRYPATLQQLIEQGTTHATEYLPTGFEQAISVLNTAQEKSRTLVDILVFSTCAGGVEELARGLTCIESEIFHRCLPTELIQLTDQGSHPVIDKMQRWISSIGLFVSRCILERHDPASRAQVFELFVEVAAICKTMRNYSSTMSLLLALCTPRVTRLKQTLKFVSRRHMVMLSDIRHFFYLRANFKDYRDELSSYVGPAVPLLTIVKTDVMYIRGARNLAQETYQPKNHYRPTDEFIDIQMYRKLRDVVRVLESCYAPYKLPKVSFATRWLYTSIRPFEDVDTRRYEAKFQMTSERLEPPPVLKHKGSWVQDDLWKLGNWK